MSQSHSSQTKSWHEYGHSYGQVVNSAAPLENAVLTLDVAQNTVTLIRTGKTVTLTPAETRLLGILVCNPGRTMTRDVLTIKVWGTKSALLDQQLDIYISRLRNKIEQNPSEPQLLLPVGRIGYRFRLDNMKHR
jgi:DNA-binding response OmpR family regulator